MSDDHDVKLAGIIVMGILLFLATFMVLMARDCEHDTNAKMECAKIHSPKECDCLFSNAPCVKE